MQLFIKHLNNLLKLKYWFNLTPEPFLPIVLKILYIFFGVLLMTGIAARIVSGKYKNNPPLRNIWQKFYYFLTTISVFGLILISFRQQHIYFLGAPFWLIFWLITAIIWLVFIIRYIVIRVPKIKEEIELKKEMEKYLP